MKIKQQIEKFFKANPNLKKDDPTLYHTHYQVSDYKYDSLQNKHNLIIVSSNFSNQRTYIMERIGELDPDLIECLKRREEVVFFWSHEQLNTSNLFFFVGEGYYWTIFPKKDFTEKQNAQEWLESQEKYNTEEKRREIIRLEFANWKTLEGDLDLRDFKKLKEIYLPNHQLTKIDLSNSFQIEGLNCPNNKLTNINSLLSSLDPEKLRELDLSNNNFSESDLTPFSELVNLEELNISDNNFYGSLEPLKSLTNLKKLYIHNTNISNGLEYLPDNLEIFKCYDANYEKTGAKAIEFYNQELSDFEGDIKTWKEFYNSLAQKWLDEEYPRNSEENLNSENSEASLDLDFLYQEESIVKKSREKVKSLVISDKNLKGTLRLKGFISLEELSVSNNQLTKLFLSDCPKLANLYCENNQLTHLNLNRCKKIVKLNCSNNKLLTIGLNDCPNLMEINCSKNEFYELNFFNSVGGLKVLKMGNNQKISPPSLKNFPNLKELENLDISNCSFEGSLKPLEKLKKLEELNITNTNLNEGLEYLPANCQKLYCNSDYQYKSSKIMEELEKSNCSEREEENRYYIPSKWREDKQNNMIASVIPLERLYVIRGNVKQFLKKWEIKNENEPSELSKLHSPEELWKHRWRIYATIFLGRGAAVAGAVLTFQDYSAIGGGILGIYPFSELVVSKLEENLKCKENKWKEFLTDADRFLDNYNELLGILSQFEIEELKGGTVSKALKSLDKKLTEFLKVYDNDGNREIDIEELISKRDKLTQELNEKENKIQGIIDTIKELETEIIKYRKSSYEIGKEKLAIENEQLEENKVETEIQINIEYPDQVIENRTGSITNNSSRSLLLTKETNKGGSSLLNAKKYLTNRRKKYSKKQEKFGNEQEVHELQELPKQEQLEAQVEVPFYEIPGSSKK